MTADELRAALSASIDGVNIVSVDEDARGEATGATFNVRTIEGDVCRAESDEWEAVVVDYAYSCGYRERPTLVRDLVSPPASERKRLRGRGNMIGPFDQICRALAYFTKEVKYGTLLTHERPDASTPPPAPPPHRS